MQIYSYNAEKKGRNRNDLFLKVGLFGAFCGLILIGGLKVLSFMLGLAVKYFLWILVIAAAALLARHFMRRRRK